MNQVTLRSCCAALVLALITASPGLSAQQGSSLQSLTDLVQQQDFESALQLANRLLPEWEGDPRFDYLYGLSARGNGLVHQALFAFERAVHNQPDSAAARFALASTYFEVGNMPAAQREFERLQQSGLDGALADSVARYLDTIQRWQGTTEPHWRNWVQVGLGHDSNPNSGVEDEFVHIPLLGQVRLFEQSREISSSYYDVQAQVQWIVPQDQHSAFNLLASILHAQFSDDAVWSRSYASLQGGYETRLGSYEMHAQAFYRPLRLDSEAYLDYYGVKAGVLRPWRQGWQLGLDLTLANQQYDQLSELDKQVLMADGWIGAVTDSGEHKLLLRWGRENADLARSDFNSRDYQGIGYQWRHAFAGQWLTSISLDYLDADYEAVHPLFGEVRKDSFLRAELELRYRFNNQWQWSTNLTYLDNDSDLTLYQYQRTKLWTGARYVF
ncbi:tetratricopeptide repeat protein [Bowmanella dokdonensis]|uniref:DUF560 domain-containing protein n=1 Tax=Bowmanella dokdonensis TaxID=751969 RepID=A0A939DMJ7_9ALTE|nr:tetratricopeptide repeat protein [Bowmanella dokdonensis]MBN7825350.1 DUF560 domain-containing protein [Bowmanella dokdonensis]